VSRCRRPGGSTSESRLACIALRADAAAPRGRGQQLHFGLDPNPALENPRSSGRRSSTSSSCRQFDGPGEDSDRWSDPRGGRGGDLRGVFTTIPISLISRAVEWRDQDNKNNENEGSKEASRSTKPAAAAARLRAFAVSCQHQQLQSRGGVGGEAHADSATGCRGPYDYLHDLVTGRGLERRAAIGVCGERQRLRAEQRKAQEPK